MGYQWRPYVPVRQRTGNAAREMERLRKKGISVQPVRIEGRKIARTFWGEAWCNHLENLSDYENRLPRGRTYVRNGSVCHLEIRRGGVEAKVQGSALYSVSLEIKPLGTVKWKSIKERCTGRISSILDLLQGSLSAGVMSVVTDPENGMFPKPKEIGMKCSCPDWAIMCKHVAAVMYGIGARLDEKPELLFLLRGVDHGELIGAKVEEAVGAAVKGGKRRRLAEDELSGVFGIEIDAVPTSGVRARASGTRRRSAGGKPPVRPFPEEITGAHVQALRKRLKLDPAAFARLIGLSRQIVDLWEKSRKALNLRSRSRAALEAAWAMDDRSASVAALRP